MARLTMRAMFTGAALLAYASAARGELQVQTDFAGGAAEVVSIDQEQSLITFRIPQQKNGGWQAWWSLKVSGIEPGKTIALCVLNGNAQAGRAVWSTDQKAWQFTAPGERGAPKGSITYRQKIEAKEAWFAWFVPYGPADAEALAKEAVKRPFVKVFDLCKSEEGRPVLALRIREGEADENRAGVWIQARQHAWEVGSSWTADGLARWFISDDPRAKNLRRSAEVTIIPIMDVDSVFGGRGGKDQRPHDHNRDWTLNPQWNSVIAAMKTLKEMDRAGKLDLFLDLHDPGWGGKVEFWCHTYKTQEPTRRQNTDLFMQACAKEITGPLAFDGKAIARYPLSTPTSGIWASSRTGAKVVGGTFEIGVAPPRGCEDPPPTYHLRCGREMGLGIERFVAGERRKE